MPAAHKRKRQYYMGRHIRSRVVKYVRRNPDPSQVTLKSANPDYDPIEIQLDNIIALYPVKAIVNLNICL
jgi:phage repressor protein C with HTH and peptisase S24 domain